MNGFDTWALSLGVFLPMVGALLITVIPRAQEQAVKAIALVASGAALVVSIIVLARFNFGSGTRVFQFVVNKSWIETIGARYHMGVDGIGLPMFALTTLLTFLCVVYSLKTMPNPCQGVPKNPWC